MSPPDPASPGPHLTPEGALALLEWQIAMGADEAIGEVAPDRLAPPVPAAAVAQAAAIPAPLPPVPPVSAAAAPSLVAPPVVSPPAALAESLAEAAQSARALAAG